jgi:hypothetical protein
MSRQVSGAILKTPSCQISVPSSNADSIGLKLSWNSEKLKHYILSTSCDKNIVFHIWKWEDWSGDKLIISNFVFVNKNPEKIT